MCNHIEALKGIDFFLQFTLAYLRRVTTYTQTCIHKQSTCIQVKTCLLYNSPDQIQRTNDRETLACFAYLASLSGIMLFFVFKTERTYKLTYYEALDRDLYICV